MTRILTLTAAALVLSGAVAFLTTTATAKPRPARCVIDAAGAARWAGPCRFAPERGGSFTVTPARGAFQNGIGSISVAVVRPGLAEVRGLTRAGVNSRWGEAQRSRRDGACWVGSDFSVCVY